MALLSLNYDVLSEIVAQTDAKSALKLSMASRKAYDIGLPQALSCITLSRSQRQISAFCQFVLADPQNRLPCLRELIIESPAFGVARHIEFQRNADFSAAAELADVLEGAHRLKVLSIACFEDLVAKEPRVGSAVCALPDLTDLGLHNCGQAAIALLPRLRSSPHKVSITILFDKKLPTLFQRLVHLRHLESLEISNLDVSDGSQPHGEIHELPIVPSVHSFTLKGSTARMSLFVKAMPNLRDLHISDVYTKVEEDSDHLKDGCWMRLAQLRANVPDLRCWKFVYPVGWLQLGLTAYHYDDAVNTVSRCSPIVLSLPVETKVDATFWTRLVTAAPRLRHLEICLDEGKLRKLNWWIDNIPQILGTLSITSLFICVRHTHWVDSPMECPKSDWLNDASCRRLQEHILASMPSLQYVALAIATKGEDPFESSSRIHPSWWRIRNDSGRRKWEAMSSDVGERLRDHLLQARFNSLSHE
ncbi:uncharacterized protein LAESUDRAFT_765060 [Laetiporus sulphureus 93-53]|uniref:F-box domain-containing protein n=1 Tax=Laetiporus sulphureus 93-53 TaxID=1314785 RepID=A0A165AZN2_9APHY|nr:uncharacterized protein LAESUDRAFT_765060 [Laetiporus sulphureus 93-53]KZS99953.1 hypothetical protein LAESUDRAFT_765060 [Laetiporus sulphureus 93-53]